MGTNYRLTAATGIHKGDRQYQQDQVAILQHPRNKGCILGVVADGMGGRSGGRKAADQVLLTARQMFERFDPETDDPTAFLQGIVKESHLVIRLTAISAEQEPHSTIAAFLVTPRGQCHWVHAGDSRIYHFQWGRMVFRTRDHSYVQSLIDSGEISEEEAIGHPNSNVLVGCLGSEVEPPATIHSVAKLEPGDVVLACSDGLWAHFTPQELGQTVQMLGARDAAMFLTNKARERANGGGDNLSMAILKIEPLQSAADQAPTDAPSASAGADNAVI
ncbi:serine/threonine-protein phosphatase [Corticibacter populi]|uniref:Serine/threonine-protein phosphatase n=1 Tax=Corticibacter populi TaxID=1550736 RepID=A0A3M6QZV9_9BURK|nr:protein phosphatase 2C domain-containing protein [Corticibacter populi]RMX08072.1 serine/threonine-protein phosphatase [Corticibacter populi]RZS35320.1 serine/threonine protein phosphatase PrpC [Corticibacter populi]